MKTGTPERGAGGWGTIALPAFGLSVNPIPTRGADYAHLITTPPPRFMDGTPPLLKILMQCLCDKKVSFGKQVEFRTCSVTKQI